MANISNEVADFISLLYGGSRDYWQNTATAQNINNALTLLSNPELASRTGASRGIDSATLGRLLPIALLEFKNAAGIATEPPPPPAPEVSPYDQWKNAVNKYWDTYGKSPYFETDYNKASTPLFKSFLAAVQRMNESGTDQERYAVEQLSNDPANRPPEAPISLPQPAPPQELAPPPAEQAAPPPPAEQAAPPPPAEQAAPVDVFTREPKVETSRTGGGILQQVAEELAKQSGLSDEEARLFALQETAGGPYSGIEITGSAKDLPSYGETVFDVPETKELEAAIASGADPKTIADLAQKRDIAKAELAQKIDEQNQRLAAYNATIGTGPSVQLGPSFPFELPTTAEITKDVIDPETGLIIESSVPRGSIQTGTQYFDPRFGASTTGIPPQIFDYKKLEDLLSQQRSQISGDRRKQIEEILGPGGTIGLKDFFNFQEGKPIDLQYASDVGPFTDESALFEQLGQEEQQALETARQRYLQEQLGILPEIEQLGKSAQERAEGARQRYLAEQEAISPLFEEEGGRALSERQKAIDIFRAQQEALAQPISELGTQRATEAESARQRYLQEQFGVLPEFERTGAAEQSALAARQQQLLAEAEKEYPELIEKYQSIFAPAVERSIRQGADIFGARGLGTGGFQGSGAIQELVRKASQESTEKAALAGLQNLLAQRATARQLGTQAALTPAEFARQSLAQRVGVTGRGAELGLEASRAAYPFQEAALQQRVGAGTQAAQLGLEASELPSLYRQQALQQKVGARQRAAELGLEAAQIPTQYGQLGLQARQQALGPFSELGLEAAQAPLQARRAGLQRRLSLSDILRQQQQERQLANLGASASVEAARQAGKSQKESALISAGGGLLGGIFGAFGKI